MDSSWPETVIKVCKNSTCRTRLFNGVLLKISVLKYKQALLLHPREHRCIRFSVHVFAVLENEALNLHLLLRLQRLHSKSLFFFLLHWIPEFEIISSAVEAALLLC